MNRNRFLRFPFADARRWATRHGVEMFDAACSGCGAVLRTTIPIASGTLRGFMAPKCECGSDDTPYCFAISDEMWRKGTEWK